MVAGCSEGMHGRQLCSSDEGGGSRGTGGGSGVLPSGVHTRSEAGAVVSVRRAAVERFFDGLMAAPGVPQRKSNFEPKKLSTLASCKTLAS